MADFKEIEPADFNESPFKLIGNDNMLITAEKDGKINTMTAGWGGFGVMWETDVVFIVIRPQRYTKKFVEANDYFSLSFFDGNYKKELGYLGSVSGRDEDKITKSGLTLKYDQSAPYFVKANKALICKKLYQQEFNKESFIDKSLIDKWYPDNDFHILYIGKVEKTLIK